MVGSLFTVLLFYVIPEGFAFLDSIALFLIGLFVFGPQMLIGVAAAELSHKKAAATATGFAGCFAYLGAATAGYPLGRIIRDYGWGQYFILLAICSFLAAAVVLPLWSIKTNPKH